MRRKRAAVRRKFAVACPATGFTLLAWVNVIAASPGQTPMPSWRGYGRLTSKPASRHCTPSAHAPLGTSFTNSSAARSGSFRKTRVPGYAPLPCTSSRTQAASRKSRPSWTGRANGPNRESAPATVTGSPHGNNDGRPATGYRSDPATKPRQRNKRPGELAGVGRGGQLSGSGGARCGCTRAAAQGPAHPGSAAPDLRRGLRHPARPVFDAADVGEGRGPVDLLDLPGEVIVHASERMAKAPAAILGENRILGRPAGRAATKDSLGRHAAEAGPSPARHGHVPRKCPGGRIAIT